MKLRHRGHSLRLQQCKYDLYETHYSTVSIEICVVIDRLMVCNYVILVMVSVHSGGDCVCRAQINVYLLTLLN